MQMAKTAFRPSVVSSVFFLLATLPKKRKGGATEFFEYRSVRLWSKDSNGTRTGGRKNYFF